MTPATSRLGQNTVCSSTRIQYLAMEHYRYSVSDPGDPRFFATGVVEGEELLIEIRTELPSGERSAALNGPNQLRQILAHFFPRYKSIRTSWCFGENLVTFNRGNGCWSNA